MSKWVLPIYDESGGKLCESVCDTREVAETAKAQMIEMDLAEFEKEKAPPARQLGHQ